MHQQLKSMLIRPSYTTTSDRSCTVHSLQSTAGTGRPRLHIGSNWHRVTVFVRSRHRGLTARRDSMKTVIAFEVDRQTDYGAYVPLVNSSGPCDEYEQIDSVLQRRVRLTSVCQSWPVESTTMCLASVTSEKQR